MVVKRLLARISSVQIGSKCDFMYLMGLLLQSVIRVKETCVERQLINGCVKT
jgi:hypothetical protein